jgi:hypothetical protein
MPLAPGNLAACSLSESASKGQHDELPVRDGASAAVKPGIPQIITSIYRLPSRQTTYHVVLGCGHRYTVTQPEVDHQQLIVGKPVECGECAQQDDQ